MKKILLEKYLIENCSPTLASLKNANMFSCRCASLCELCDDIRHWNAGFCSKGLELMLLKYEKGTALLYLCRREKLKLALAEKDVSAFLSSYGYESCDFSYSIEKLKSRLKFSPSFPHEIGVFLGYPLGDVKGFIENRGENCKCAGTWKVYCNECEALKTFDKFSKCTAVYSRLWRDGVKTVMQLAVKT